MTLAEDLTLPELPQRLSPFLDYPETYSPRDYEAERYVQRIQDLVVAHRKAQETYHILMEIHLLIQGWGIKCAGEREDPTALDYSFDTIRDVARLTTTLEAEIGQGRAGEEHGG